jgi:translation initiation factor eIF-2B subunit gamma
MNVSTTLQDAHIYIFKRWVIDLISKNEKISSLRTDLLPILSKMQWQSNLRKQQGINERNYPQKH